MKTERIIVKGVVQGVGFRPFLYRLAWTLNLKGYIKNTNLGVEAILSGPEEALVILKEKIKEAPPENALIKSLISEKLPYSSFESLEVLKGEASEEVDLDLLPDLAICQDCRKEFYDPKDRRYQYPFIACTNCGPRYSMLLKLPYERENTTMVDFPLCAQCQKEYTNPLDRRFHAEPTSCPLCGPRLFLYQAGNPDLVAEGEEAIELAKEALRQGQILAVKGLTGFHLMGRADKEEVLKALRERKRRPKKPLAVMFPTVDLLKEYCEVEDKDLVLFFSGKSPILLLPPGKRAFPPTLTERVNLVGAMLPYTPLHLRLLQGLTFPVVATSGNISEEPLIYEDEEAIAKLLQIADYLLLHNRRIVRPADDSVLKKVGKEYLVIRLGRGYTPSPHLLPFRIDKVCLALGAQDKNTFTLGVKDRLVLSPHFGDLSVAKTMAQLEKMLCDYLQIYKIKRVDLLICDLHPRYESTRFAKRLAEEWGCLLLPVQHHLAHLWSVLAEKGLFPQEPMLGFSWDGTGFGADGMIWGGETLLLQGLAWQRVRTIKPFKLLGGERAIKDTRKIALSLLFAVYGEETFQLRHPLVQSFSEGELLLLYEAWQKGVNSPWCSSCGRLFDALSALLGVCYYNTYEGEAPMKLESFYQPEDTERFPYNLEENFYFAWEPMIREIVERRPDPKIAVTRFINTLVDYVCQTALDFGIPKIIISGGVMVNGPLILGIMRKLKAQGFEVLRNKKFPPLDGGISVGQAYYGLLYLREEAKSS